MRWEDLFGWLAYGFNSVDQPDGKSFNWRLVLVLAVGLGILLVVVKAHDVLIQGNPL